MRSRRYCDQLIDLPNSPSLTTSTPAAACRRTTAATDASRHWACARSSYACASCFARRWSSSAGGRIRLPTCVVRILSRLRFIRRLVVDRRLARRPPPEASIAPPVLRREPADAVLEPAIQRRAGARFVLVGDLGRR